MKKQPEKTAEQLYAEFQKMTEEEKLYLDHVNKALEADQTSLEEKLSPVREMIRGLSQQLFAPPNRERKDRNTNAPDTDYVLAEQTLRNLQNIRNRQSSPEINRSRQFDLLHNDMLQQKAMGTEKDALPNERHTVQSEQAPNYESTVVKIGIIDEQGMHTVRVHSAEEAAKTLAAAYGWETPEQDSPQSLVTSEPALPELTESEEARNMENYRQAMADTWNEREEQFRNEMDDLER